MVREAERLIYEGRIKINKMVLISLLDKVPLQTPEILYIEWYQAKYGEDNGNGEIPKFGFDEFRTKIYTFWHGDIQMTVGEDRQFGLRQFFVGRIELKTPPDSGDLFTDISIVNSWSPLRSHYEMIANTLRAHEAKRRSKKKGPIHYSDDEKLKALREWDQLDKSKYPITVQDWLVRKFGEEGGVPKVSKSTFYGWKKPLGYKSDQ